ncbi:MAG: hypothetical protein RMM98_06085 [Acidobacteriota bacterium]|nr:hypothetical protein [Blastocatellia bacterium]MDW8239166.1 hypothetical protein [Acidobacteriota bacterium]
MFNRKSIALAAFTVALIGAAILFTGLNNTSAQGLRLAGSYVFMTAGGSTTEATIGVVTFDGNGNITGGALELHIPRSAVAPGQTGRTVIPVQVTGGSYTLNANGTGSTSAVAQAPPPIGTLTRNYSLVVVESTGSVATRLRGVQIEPTVAGNLGYFELVRIGN